MTDSPANVWPRPTEANIEPVTSCAHPMVDHRQKNYLTPNQAWPKHGAINKKRKKQNREDEREDIMKSDNKRDDTKGKRTTTSPKQTLNYNDGCPTEAAPYTW